MSLIKTAHRQGRNASRFCLMTVVYLLVILYTVSHTHKVHEDFSAKAHSLSTEEALDDHANHWHSDQHHSAACQLISQAPPSLNLLSADNALCSPFNTVEKVSSASSVTPTKRLTRAPPVLV
ncbi:hypothetical protein [Endozoicomonas arenosclerae]|uniref:hypothetical protein n=1 Tax=Endozoicomonas arenosclerae TaxID=1633495 RepID=UPI0012947AF5|nr:hypothetical protein [Endozoicomonas arenosclerae]